MNHHANSLSALSLTLTLSVAVLASAGAVAQPLNVVPAQKLLAKPDKVQYDTVGPVYQISEPDMLEEILALIKRKQQSGEIDRINQKMVEDAKRLIDTPEPVAGLTFARRQRSWFYDPSITLTQDVLLPDGSSIGKAGQRISPLSQAAWAPWLFIDQRDPTQVRTAKQWLVKAESKGQRAKIVVVGGSWRKASEALGRYVYFDQAGVYINRFSIQAVPAEVVQDGLVLKVSEFPTY